MRQYLHLLSECTNGEARRTRSGLVRTTFGHHLEFNCGTAFPILTTKKVNFHAIRTELLWFLRGDTTLDFLHQHGVHIWDANALHFANGRLHVGPSYGKQWRSWKTGEIPSGAPDWAPEEIGVDQVRVVRDTLRVDPHSRRHIISAWNVAQLDEMALPPCHVMCQFAVLYNSLHLHVYQRSADVFLGLPFNISSYALFLHLMSMWADYAPGTLTISLGDVHLYENHVEQAELQLSRTPRELPLLHIDWGGDLENITEAKPEFFTLAGYDPHPAIKAPISP